jgi:hypothetical protein
VAALSARRDELARQLADIAGRHATMVARNADMAATNAQLKQQALAACTSEEQWQQLMRSLPTPAYPPSNIYPTMPGWSQGLSSSSSSSSSLHPAGCLPTPLLPAPAAAPAMVGCVPTGPYIHEHQQQQQQQEQQRATWLSGGGCSVLHPCNPASPAATTGGCLYISAQRSSSLALNRFEAASDTRMSSQGPIKPESLSASDNSDRASPGVSDTITGLAPGLQWGSPVSQGQSLGYTSSCTNPSPLHTEQQQQQQQQQQQLEVHHGSRECVESVPQQLAQASWPAAEQAAAGVYAAAAAAAGPPSMASAVCTSSGGAGHTSVLYHSWQSVPGFRMQRPPPLEQVGGMGSTAVLLPAAALGGSRPMAAAAAGDHGRSSTSAAAVSRDAYQRALGVVHCDRYTALLAPLSQPPGLKSAAAAAEGPVGRMSSGAGMYSQQQPCSAATNGCFTQAYGSHRQGGSTDCVRPAVQDAGRVRPVGTLPTPQPLQLNGSHSSYRGSSRGVLLQWPSHLVGPMLVSQGQASLAAGHMLNGLPGPPACPLGKAGPYAVASTMPPQPPAVAAAGGRGLELWNIAAMQRRERSEGFDAGAGPAAPAQHPEHWATVATGESVQHHSYTYGSSLHPASKQQHATVTHLALSRSQLIARSCIACATFMTMHVSFRQAACSMVSKSLERRLAGPCMTPVHVTAQQGGYACRSPAGCLLTDCCSCFCTLTCRFMQCWRYG